MRYLSFCFKLGQMQDKKFEGILTVHCHYYVEIKCQLDATDDIYCRFYCMLNMFRQYYAHHQELESIIQMVAACGIA